jgi:hypothetical protein
VSYHHYTTEGVILKRENRGENDAVYVVFTEMLGLIVAHASGIRLLKSKLRFVLQPGNKVRITVVRGKTLWRVTTCSLIHSLPVNMHMVLLRLYKLLRTHLVFDEPVMHIYGHVQSFLVIDKSVYMQVQTLRTAEIITMARILSSLGMLDHVDKVIDENSALTSDFCNIYEAESLTLLKHVKSRLHESVL